MFLWDRRKNTNGFGTGASVFTKQQLADILQATAAVEAEVTDFLTKVVNSTGKAHKTDNSFGLVAGLSAQGVF